LSAALLALCAQPSIKVNSPLKNILATIVLSLSAISWADTDSHWSKAEEYVALSGSSVFLQNMIERQEQALDAETELIFNTLKTQEFMSDEISVHLVEHNAQAKKVMHRVFGVEVVSERIIPLYMANFSESELDQLIAFYKSDIGTSLRERLPVILIQTNEVDMELAREFIEAMIPINEKLQKDLGLVQ